MTMILGFNLGDLSYITGDTRVSYRYDSPKDDVQKIEIIKPLGLVVAAAGSAIVAAEFIEAIKARKISIPIQQNKLLSETENFVEHYLEKILSLKHQPHNPLNPIVLLFQHVIDDKIQMVAYHFTFVENNTKIIKLREFIVKAGEYVKIGAIGNKAPICVCKIPSSSIAVLRSPLSGSIPFEVYLTVTNEIFEIAKSEGEIKIGGKTTTLMTCRIDKNKYFYNGIKGFKSVVHSDDSYQDVSMYTDLDINTGVYYVRDMRKEGIIVSNIEFAEGRYRLRYDSCPKEIGSDDVYYKLFSTFQINSTVGIEAFDFNL